MRSRLATCALVVAFVALMVVPLPSSQALGATTATVAASSPVPAAAPAPTPATVRPDTVVTSTAVKWDQMCASGNGTGSCPPNYQPIAAYKAASFYDPVNQWTIYFGGQFFTNVTLNGTFEWNQTATQWLRFNVTAVHAPVARSNITGVWDWNDKVGVVFGGYQSTVYPTVRKYLNDTWEWLPGTGGVGMRWSNVTNSVHPSARADYMMTYVPTYSGHGGYVLLFGGTRQGNHLLNDTWEFNAGTWTNITSTAGNAPPPVAAGGMVYDDVDHYAVLFGGETGSGMSNGTYEFNPATSTWSTIFANGSTVLHSGPRAMAAFSMDNDTQSGYVFLTGSPVKGTYPNLLPNGNRQSWAFLGGQWSNLTYAVNHNDAIAGTTAAPELLYASLAYEPTYRFGIFQGGRPVGGGTTNGTFEVGALMSVAVAVNLGEVVEGHPVTVWANTTFAVTPVTYVWTVPAGCANPGNVSTFSCSPTSTGFQRFSVTATDNDGAVASNTWAVWVDSVGSQTGSLVLNTTLPFSIASTFYATDLRYSASGFNPLETGFINASPIRTFRGPTLEGFNALTGQNFNPNCPAGSSAPGGYTLCLNFPAWTQYMAAIGGQSFITLPSLENNTTLDVADANFVMRNMSYTPMYWTFGNEPEGWTCFNVSIGTKCPAIGTVAPALSKGTAYRYGIAMTREARAVEAVYPTVPVMAIQTNGNCLDNAFMGAAALYGHDYTSVTSCHLYPSWLGYSVNSPTVYAYLSPRNLTLLTTNLPVEAAYLSSLCAGCLQPIWVTEFNTASGGAGGKANPFYNYTQGWPSVPALTVNMILAARTQVPSWLVFATMCQTNNSLAILNDNCSMKAPAFVYTNIFAHFRGSGQVYNASLTGVTMRGVYSLYGTNASGTSLLMTNANTTVTAVAVLPPGFDANQAVTAYIGTKASGWTVVNYPAGELPTSFTLVPMEDVLLDTNGSAGGSASGVWRTPPTNLTPTSVGFSAVSLSWEYSFPSAVLYSVVHYGYDCSDLVGTQMTEGNATYATVGHLLPLTTYCFTVSVTTVAGATTDSDPVRVQTAFLPSSADFTPQFVVTPSIIGVGVVGVAMVAVGGNVHRHKFRITGGVAILIGGALIGGVLAMVSGLIPGV